MNLPTLFSERTLSRVGLVVLSGISIWMLQKVVDMDKEITVMREQNSTNEAQWKAIAGLSKDVTAVRVTAEVNKELLKLLVIPEKSSAEEVVAAAAPVTLGPLKNTSPGRVRFAEKPVSSMAHPPGISAEAPVHKVPEPPVAASAELLKPPRAEESAKGQAARWIKLAEQVRTVDETNTPEQVKRQWETK